MSSTQLHAAVNLTTGDIHAMFSDTPRLATLAQSAGTLSGFATSAPARQIAAFSMNGQSNLAATAIMNTFASTDELPTWVIRKLEDYRSLRQQNAELCARGQDHDTLGDPVAYARLQAFHTQSTQAELQSLLSGATDASLSRVVSDTAFDQTGIRLQALAIIEFRNRHQARQQRNDIIRLGRELHDLNPQQLAQTLAGFPAAVLAYLADEPSLQNGNPAIGVAALAEFIQRHEES